MSVLEEGGGPPAPPGKYRGHDVFEGYREPKTPRVPPSKKVTKGEEVERERRPSKRSESVTTGVGLGTFLHEDTTLDLSVNRTMWLSRSPPV